MQLSSIMFQLRSLNIGPRILLSFATVLVPLVIAAAISTQLSKNRTDEVQRTGERATAVQLLIQKWISTVELNALRTEQLMASTDIALMSSLDTERQQTNDQADLLQPQAEAALERPGEREALAKITFAKREYGAKSTELLQLLDGDRPTVQARWADEGQPAARAYLAALREAANANDLSRAKAMEDSQQQFVAIRLGIMGALTAALALGMGFAYRVSKSVTGPLAEMKQALDAIRQGDLTYQAKAGFRDETGLLLQNLSETAKGLNSLMQEVTLAAVNVANSSQEIAQGTQDLSVRTENQAASLEKSASAIEQVSANVQSTAKNCEVASYKAAATNAVGAEAQTAVAGVSDSMLNIHTASQKIGEMVEIIDGIAFRTNILALNAAVEAAHAGDQGRGFAVVASEVRSLARRSADASREIRLIVTNTRETVNSGAGQAKTAGTVMASVTGSVTEMRTVIDEISHAAKEQALGLAEITKAIQMLDNATQQNAALVEQSAASAASLQDNASHLFELTKRFKL